MSTPAPRPAADDAIEHERGAAEAASTPELVRPPAPALPAPRTPEGLAPLVELLATQRYDPATIRELLEIQREHKADLAREAFSEALARFRTVAPTLAKDRTVDFETRNNARTTYRHTSLGYGMSVVNPLLGELGLNIAWHPRVEGSMIHVETRLTHALGHAESVTLSGPADTSGSKNAIQAMKSTITYLERTGAFALLGLASSEDDDGRGAAHAEASAPPAPDAEEPPPLEDAHVSELVELLDACEELDAGFRSRWTDYYGDHFPAAATPLGLALPASKGPAARAQLVRALEQKQAAQQQGGRAAASGEDDDEAYRW